MNKYLLLLALFSSSVLSEPSFFWMKGHAWNNSTFNDEHKLFYVSGLMDGFIFSQKDVSSRYIGSQFSAKQYLTALTRFYSDCRNTNIPVPFAMEMITLLVKGTDAQAIELLLVDLRSRFSDSK